MRQFRVVVRLSLLAAVFLATLQAWSQSPEGLYNDLYWRMVGPFRGGRTRAAAGVPSLPNVFYMAQVNGGVWKTDDYGRTWNPIFDHESTQSIGAIAVAPSDPNILYVASGEGLHRPDLSVGNGIYKSTDAGKTWKHLDGLRDGQQIPALVVDPRDPNKIVAAVLGHPYGPSEERGIYRSTDGGQTWQKVLSKDENTGGSDIELDPSNPDFVYASMWEVREGPWEDGNEFNGRGGGLFKSTDGGATWHQLSKGLPSDLSQIYVAIAPSDSRRLYATLATASGKLAVYGSDDGGDSWSQIADDPRPSGRIGGGDLPIPRVDPKNPDVLYVASTVTMKSTDGGKTWFGFRGAPGGDDYQNLWINPNNGNIILLVSDQGAIITVNGGATWSSWYNQPTAQLYHAIADNSFPYRVCAGQQESGSVCVRSRGNDGAITFREWHPVGVIEYGYVAPDPLDPDVIYGAGRTEVSKYHWSTGQVQDITPIPVRNQKYRANRTEPLMFSPVDPHVFYYATNVLFKTTDGGNTWQTISEDLTRKDPGAPASVGTLMNKDMDKTRGVIYALAPSFKDINTLWVGTDDGLIWITHDGGKSWNDITPKELTPWSKVTQITASHFDERTAYASVSRFRINDMHPYIYRTRDGGKSWTLITNGLPEFGPVDTIREDHVLMHLLFAGTENSVYFSLDDGDHWQSLQLNLPHTAVRDLWIHDDDLIAATHGRGFWILDNMSPLRQAQAGRSPFPFLFTGAKPAYRVQRDTNTDTPLPPDEPMAPNPPDGAMIDYYLPAATNSVTIEIHDEKMQLVRKFSNTDKPEITEEELQKQLIPLYWVRPQRHLSAEPGMHRWVWDLHYPPPLSMRHEYPIAAVPHDTPRGPLGPSVLPGTYEVRFTADGTTLVEYVVVKMDPRMKATPESLQKKFHAERQLAALMTQTTQAVLQANSIRSQLEKLSQSNDATKNAVADFQKRLVALVGAQGGFFAVPSPEPTLNRVNGEVSTLYQQIWQVDAEPTSSQMEALNATERAGNDVLKRWVDWKNTAVPELNRVLRESQAPEVRIEDHPAQVEIGVDEE